MVGLAYFVTLWANAEVVCIVAGRYLYWRCKWLDLQPWRGKLLDLQPWRGKWLDLLPWIAFMLMVRLVDTCFADVDLCLLIWLAFGITFHIQWYACNLLKLVFWRASLYSGHGCCQGSAFFVGPVMVSPDCFPGYTICDIGLLVFRLLNAQHIHTGNDDNYRCLQILWLWFSNTNILAGQPYPSGGCSHGWCSILLLYLQTLVISPWLIWRRHYPGGAALPRWWLQPWLAFPLSEPVRDDHPVLVQMWTYVCMCNGYSAITGLD